MFKDLKNELIKYGSLSGARGYTPGLSGNMSCRRGDKIVITSTGTANGFLSEDDICIIDFNGNISDGKKRPSSEMHLHLEFYRQREDINAILHFHSPHLTAFALSGIAPNKNILPEIVYAFGEIPIADYALPGSEDLVKNTSVYFKSHDVILMKNHGVIVGAKDLKNAFLKLETCENYAKTLLFSKILGGAKILPKDEVEKIYSLRN